MRPYYVILVPVIFLFVTIYCKSSRDTIQPSKENATDNSMTSVDWAGRYQGILPCANCDGIQTQLTLNNDLTYMLETRYNGKDKKVFQTKGAFQWNETGSKIILDNTEKQIYLVGENMIFHLDKDGNRITGDLASKYILEKEKTELTGKYWKLVRLNGKPVETSERVAFVMFDKVENRVHGNSSCNMFNGKYELQEGNRIKFSPLAMTRMACIGNNIESEFIQVFEKTCSYSMTSSELIFQDEYETTLTKFEADFFN